MRQCFRSILRLRPWVSTSTNSKVGTRCSHEPCLLGGYSLLWDARMFPLFHESVSLEIKRCRSACTIKTFAQRADPGAYRSWGELLGTLNAHTNLQLCRNSGRSRSPETSYFAMRRWGVGNRVDIQAWGIAYLHWQPWTFYGTCYQSCWNKYCVATSALYFAPLRFFDCALLHFCFRMLRSLGASSFHCKYTYAYVRYLSSILCVPKIQFVFWILSTCLILTVSSSGSWSSWVSLASREYTAHYSY